MKMTHAMILAAGLGLRMRPLTLDCPKPLIRVADVTLLDYALAFVNDAGIAHKVVNCYYLPEKIQQFVSQKRDDSITLIEEPVLYETGGGIQNALPHLGKSPFLCVNSDTICVNHRRHAVERMADAWQQQPMDICWLVMPVERAVGYDGQGDFVRGADGALRRRHRDERGEYVFTGVQLLNPEIFEGRPLIPYSMNDIYNQYADAEGFFRRIGHVVHDGDWLHVGDAKGLEQAERYFMTANAEA